MSLRNREYMKRILQSYLDELNELKDADNLRSLKEFGQRHGRFVQYKSRRMLNLNSNDYLGIASDATLLEGFYIGSQEQHVTDKYGMASSSSRLLTGNHPAYVHLEHIIAASYGAQAAIVFNSGYHANVGTISAIAGHGDIILSDKLNHASIIDGIRLSGAAFERYKHLDYVHLRKILEKKRGQYKKAIIISESIFSMDGDVANVAQLIALKKEFNALLYIDEAHAVGVRGARGLGICEEQNILHDVDILLGTFGKALASTGAYVVTDTIIKDILVNKARSLIFSTALPPVVVSWNAYVFKHMMAMIAQRQHLKSICAGLCTEFKNQGFEIPDSSNILPFIVGENGNCNIISEYLLEHGFLVFPVRPPTVPEHTARLRFSITADMQAEEINRLPYLIKECLHEKSLAL